MDIPNKTNVAQQKKNANLKEKKRDCKTKKLGCQFRGPIIRSKRVKHCHQRKFGRHGLRTRCCSWNNSCNLKKQCKKVRVRCHWKGAARFEYFKNECKLRIKKKEIILKE